MELSYHTEKVKTKIGELTGVYYRDKESGGYSVYFAEKPEVISEGDTIEEATNNLIILFNDVLAYEEKLTRIKSNPGNFKAVEYPTEKRFYLHSGEAFYWQITSGYNIYVGTWHPRRELFIPAEPSFPLSMDMLKELIIFLEILE